MLVVEGKANVLVAVDRATAEEDREIGLAAGTAAPLYIFVNS